MRRIRSIHSSRFRSNAIPCEIEKRFLAHAGPGRHLLLNQGVYGPTRIFCDQELVPQGTTVEYFPEGADIAPYLRDNTSLVYIETPASLTMEMLDVRAVCAAARQRHIPVAVDATWGTPVFF